MRIGLVFVLLAAAVAAEDWKAKLAAVDPADRVRAAEALAKSGAADAVPDLAECLIDESEALRLAAARALGRAGPAAKSAVPALKRLFTDKSAEVQTVAIAAVARIGDVETIAELVRHDRSVLERLGTDHDDVLRVLLGARSWHVRLWVLQCKHLRKQTSAAWVPLLDSLAETDPAEVVRLWATLRLIGSTAPEALPILLRRLASKDPLMRAVGVLGASRHVKNDPAVARKLELLLADPVPQIRARTCLALRESKESKGAVERLLADPEPRVRTVAAVVSASLGTWTDATAAVVIRIADLSRLRPPFPVVAQYERYLRAGGGTNIWSMHESYPSVDGLARRVLLGGGQPAIPYVASALKREADEERRARFVYALGYLRATEELAPLLADPTQSLRRKAAACRAHLGATDAATLTILIACLADSDAMDDEEVEEQPIETGELWIHWPATAFELLVVVGDPALPALDALVGKAITPGLQRERIQRLIRRIRAAEK